MLTRLYPLRSTIGRALMVEQLHLVGHSPNLDPAGIQLIQWSVPQEILQIPGYHPTVWQGGAGAVQYGAEVLTYGVPADLPFQLAQKSAAIFVKGPQVADVLDSRKFWVEVAIRFTDPLDKTAVPLCGGLLLGGFPYAPSYLSGPGEPSANHGYPREVRLSWQDGDGSFIDGEDAVTRQIPAWQSSFHTVEIGPVVTRTLRLRISDFPRYIDTMRSWNQSTGRYTERWAVALPVVIPFTFRESTRYGSALPCGMICATQSNRSRGISNFELAHQAAGAQYDGADSAHLIVSGGKAYPFTAQSAFIHEKSRRRYPIGPQNQDQKEFFISNTMDTGDKLYWLLSQRDEQRRCVAGIRIKLPGKQTLNGLGIAGIALFRVEVFETDPLPGAAAAHVKPALEADRFSRPLAETRVDPASSDEVIVRFQRPCSSLHFYLTITASSAGHIAIDGIELIQSANVSVMSRPSRTQQLRVLHFRLAGPHLGNDYAMLGNAGFQIAVDRVVAGQRRERLFHAYSLEEMVRSGVARLIVNSRVRAVERQITRIENGSYNELDTVTRTGGWDRSETGAGVDAPSRWTVAGSPLRPDGAHGFTSMGNEETRTHVRHLANIPRRFRNRVTGRFSAMGSELDPNHELLWRATPGSTSVWAAWHVSSASDINDLKDRLAIGGLWNVSIPPYFRKLLEEVDNRGGVDNMGAIQGALNAMTGDLFTINGAGVGASSGVGAVVATFGWSNNISSSGVASTLGSHSIGTSGSITLIARTSGYSYSQSLTAHAGESYSRAEYRGGEHRQEIVREVPANEGSRNLRLAGAEILREGVVTDLILGTIPLGVELPATNESGFHTTDEAIRVSFGHVTPEVDFDVWFDVLEEAVRDDRR